MSAHNAPEWNDDRTTDPLPVALPPAGRPSAVLLVVLAAIASVTAICLALVMTHAAEQAESVATLTLLVGAGLAVGLRKRWTR